LKISDLKKGWIEESQIHIVSFGYVNDFDLIETTDTIDKAVEQLQQDLLLWEQCPPMTGRILASDKT